MAALRNMHLCEDIRREKPDFDKNNLFEICFYIAMFIGTHMEWAYSSSHILTNRNISLLNHIKSENTHRLNFQISILLFCDNAKPFNTVAEILNYLLYLV
jgi:hypothetical protein